MKFLSTPIEHVRKAVSEFLSEQIFCWHLQISLDSLLTFDRVALLYSLSQRATHKTSKELCLRNLLKKDS